MSATAIKRGPLGLCEKTPQIDDLAQHIRLTSKKNSPFQIASFWPGALNLKCLAVLSRFCIIYLLELKYKL